MIPLIDNAASLQKVSLWAMSVYRANLVHVELAYMLLLVFGSYNWKQKSIALQDTSV